MFWKTPQPEYYKVITALSFPGIAKQANQLIGEGWTPAGGLVKNWIGQYYQAFWRTPGK